MTVYGTLGSDGHTPTATELVSRVDLQDGLLDTISDRISEVVDARTQVQESRLKPIYRALSRDIAARINSQADLLSPIGSRVVTAIKGRVATQDALAHDTIEESAKYPDIIATVPDAQPPVNAGDVRIGIGDDVIVRRAAELGIPLDPRLFAPVAPHIGAPGGTPVIAGVPAPLPAAPAPIPAPAGLRIPEPSLAGSAIVGGVASTPPIEPIRPIGRIAPSAPVGIPGDPRGSDAPPGPGGPPDPIRVVRGTEPLPPVDTTVAAVRIPGVHVQWCGSDPCGEMVSAIKRIPRRVDDNPGGHAGEGDRFLSNSMYGSSIAANISWDAIARFMPGTTIDQIRANHGLTLASQVVQTQSANAILHDISPASMRDKDSASLLMGRIGAATKAARETGIPVDYMVAGEQYLFQYANPQYIPSQAEIDSTLLAGRISDAQWYCWTAAQGNIPECREAYIDAQSWQLGILDLVTLYRRGHIRTLKDLHDRARRIGVRDMSQIDQLLRVTQQLPTPSDLIHLAIRDAFDPDKLGRKEILEEYKAQVGMQELFAAQGFGEFDIYTKDGQKLTYNNAELTWLASYEEASPTQTYEMLHRLRPNRVGMFSQVIQGKRPDELRTILPGADLRLHANGRDTIVTPKPVTQYEVAKNLKEKDYNPIWRDKLTATSYHVIGRIDLRRIYAMGGFGKPLGERGFMPDKDGNISAFADAEKELYERYLDNGYTHTDANLLALYTVREYDKSKTAVNKATAGKRICEAYKLGIISREDADKQYTQLHGSPQIGKIQLDQCDIDLQIQTVKNVIAVSRKRFLDGIDKEDDVRFDLFVAGIQKNRVKELIDLWKLQLARKDKQISASQMCEWYANGSLTRKDMRSRLVNIGHSEADADRIIRTCELGELAKSAKVRDRYLRAQQRERSRLQTRADKQAKERETFANKRFAKFLQFRTDKNLTEWLGDGTITENEVYQTLISKGASHDDARRWIDKRTGKRTGGDAE